MMMLWSIVSNAFLRSIKMTPLIRPLSKLSHQFSVASIRAVKVLCSELKPDWQLASKSFSLR